MTQNTNTTAIRILKASVCNSVSGKSQLAFHIGCNAESQVFFRVHSNSSSGYFSREWVSMAAIQQVFANVPADKGITSFLLHTLFEGKSQNNAGFLFAVLVAEHLVEPVPETRYYRCTDGKQFAAAISQLLASGVSLEVAEAPAKTSSKATAKAAKSMPKSAKTVAVPAPDSAISEHIDALAITPAVTTKKATSKVSSKKG